MTGCAAYYELISSLVDGEVTDTEAARLSAHLADCPSCRALLDAYRGISAGLNDIEPPETLVKNVMDSVWGATAPRTARRGRSRRWLPIAACAALIIIAAPLLLSPKGDRATNPEYAQIRPFTAGSEASGADTEPTPDTELARGMDAAPGDSYSGAGDGDVYIVSDYTDNGVAGSFAPAEPAPPAASVAPAVGGLTPSPSPPKDLPGASRKMFEKYVAVVYVYGQLPEELEDYAMAERDDGTFWIEMPVDALRYIDETSPIEPGGDEDSDIVLVIYRPEQGVS